MYVKDTKLERTNHDATPRHQGNLKRFLRDLHRGHENEEREKERAKNEVARLKGLPSAGGAGGPVNTSSSFGSGPAPRAPKPQATEADRKKQAAQLLELGIGVPDEFRGELAIPGEWTVTSTRVIAPEGEDKKGKRPEAMGIGVRKRVVEEDEEEKIEEQKRKRRSMFRQYPGGEEDADLDQLLNQVTAPKVKEETPEVKEEPVSQATKELVPELEKQETVDGVPIKPDPEVAADVKAGPALSDVPPVGDASAKPADAEIKREEGQPAGGVVFKKRKAKNIRQK